MDVKLISISPKGVQKAFPVAAPTTTLGRQPDCDLQIPLGKISRQHCQIQMNEDRLFVKDMKSANGTFVNGKKVVQAQLKPGDIISLSDEVKFLVQIDGQPGKIDESKLRPGPIEEEKEEKPAARSTAPAVKKPAVAQKPMAPAVKKPAAKSVEDEAEQILGESFFLDLDEDEDESSH